MLLKTKRKYIKPDIIIEEVCDEVPLLGDSENVGAGGEGSDDLSGGGDEHSKSSHHMEFRFEDIDEY